MKRKLALTLLLSLSVVSLYGCGNKDNQKEVEEQTKIEQSIEQESDFSTNIEDETFVQETEEESTVIEESQITEEIETTENTIINTDDVVKFEPYQDNDTKIEIVDNILSFEGTKGYFDWSVSSIDDTILNTEIYEDLDFIKFSFTTLSPGQTTLEIVGNSEVDSIVYIVDVIVDENNNFIEFNTNRTLPDFEEPVEIELSELGKNIESIYNSLDKNSYPQSVSTMDLDINDKELLSYHYGVEEITGLTAAAISEPMMSSIAYSLSVLEFDTPDNALKAIDVLEDNAQIAKWICVAADDVKTFLIDENKVLFFMGPVETGEAIINSFTAS